MLLDEREAAVCDVAPTEGVRGTYAPYAHVTGEDAQHRPILSDAVPAVCQRGGISEDAQWPAL